MDWLANIGTWFAQNKDGIVAFMTSGTFIGLVTSIVMFIRQWRAVRNNSSNVQTLTTKVEGLDDAIRGTNELIEHMKDLKSEMSLLKDEYKELEKDNEELDKKIDSVIDAMSVAWGTLRDDTVRTNVLNILTSAKLSTEAKKAELVEKLQALENKVKESAEKTNEVVQEAVTEAKKIVTEKKPTRN